MFLQEDGRYYLELLKMLFLIPGDPNMANIFEHTKFHAKIFTGDWDVAQNLPQDGDRRAANLNFQKVLFWTHVTHVLRICICSPNLVHIGHELAETRYFINCARFHLYWRSSFFGGRDRENWVLPTDLYNIWRFTELCCDQLVRVQCSAVIRCANFLY